MLKLRVGIKNNQPLIIWISTDKTGIIDTNDYNDVYVEEIERKFTIRIKDHERSSILKAQFGGHCDDHEHEKQLSSRQVPTK